jgi:hypothetical protein
MVAQPVQVPFGYSGVEFTPVVELDAFAQGKGQALAGFVDLPIGSQAGDQF